VLEDITPIVLTHNEAPNIARTLARLSWARDIVVVDSYSDDETVALARRYAQVRLFQREFDSHARQWQFALKQTGISTNWVLALDADYLVPEALIDELDYLKPSSAVSGYRASFVYVVHGRQLHGSAYPPVTVLYRRQRAEYIQDGHTQRVSIDGRVESLRVPMLHDDRKSFDRWLESQRRYMKLEAEKLARTSWLELGWEDRVRKMKGLAPLAMAVHCSFVRGAIFDGVPGLYYTLQRVFSEVLLLLELIETERKIVRKPSSSGADVVDPAGTANVAEPR
jgi:glycosyltransferase involved in cell wall biosynthesis